MNGRTSTQILKDLMDTPGISATVIVGRDGFIIEALGAVGKLDLDMLGASLSMVLVGADRMAGQMGIQLFEQITLESKDATIVGVPIGDAILAIVSPDSKSLGMIRLSAKKFIPELARLF